MSDNLLYRCGKKNDVNLGAALNVHSIKLSCMVLPSTQKCRPRTCAAMIDVSPLAMLSTQKKATDDTVTAASLILTLPKRETFNCVMLQEFIPWGNASSRLSLSNGMATIGR